MGVPVLSYVCLFGDWKAYLKPFQGQLSASAQIVKIILYFNLFFNGFNG